MRTRERERLLKNACIELMNAFDDKDIKIMARRIVDLERVVDLDPYDMMDLVHTTLPEDFYFSVSEFFSFDWPKIAEFHVEATSYDQRCKDGNPDKLSVWRARKCR